MARRDASLETGAEFATFLRGRVQQCGDPACPTCPQRIKQLEELLAAAKFGVRAREFLREHGEASGLGSLRAREALSALLAEVRDGE